jgi:hypothetical protein
MAPVYLLSLLILVKMKREKEGGCTDYLPRCSFSFQLSRILECYTSITVPVFDLVCSKRMFYVYFITW